MVPAGCSELEYRSVLCITYYRAKSVLRKSVQNMELFTASIEVFRIGGSTICTVGLLSAVHHHVYVAIECVVVKVC